MGELERSEDEDVTEQEHAKQLTVGELRVRLNEGILSGSTLVEEIKRKSAELIDISEGLKENDPRLSALAMQYYEIACDLAVKAATM